MRLLTGHISPETAYIVEDYPYGFTLRTKIRFWLEHNGKKGTRFISQTLNPKTGKWNKPKKDTYSSIAGCLYLDENGHVKYEGLTAYSDLEGSLEYYEKYKHGLDEPALHRLLGWLKVKEMYENKRSSPNHCPKCGSHYITHEGDGSCPKEE